jgi:hypothetical protein
MSRNAAHAAESASAPEASVRAVSPAGLPNVSATPGRPPKGHNSPKYDTRIQVKLTPAGRARLDEIVARVDATGFAEVVRDALRIYDIVTEEVFVHGNEFLARSKETGEIERLSFWRTAKTNA